MQLAELQNNWDEFGKRDPFWAVLTDPRCRNNKWDPAIFFASGISDIDAALSLIDSLGLRISRFRALDFGCAMGRLTQALCRHFHSCTGVDIAPSMVRLANQYNNFPDRCHYFLNAADDLSLFPSNSFDFVYSRIVLQHIRPPHNRKFIAELVRVLDRGGVLAFQIPSEPETFGVARKTALKSLPLSAYSAAINVKGPVQNILAGCPVELSVQVRNLSNHAWPCEGTATGNYFIQLGNHWLRESGEALLWDDGRCILPRIVRPGEEVNLNLSMNAPSRPGTYILQLDMVEEGVTWFQVRGSKTFLAKVNVAPSDRAPEDRRTPVMEMHGVPREEVIQAVESAGGKIVSVLDDHSAGSWVSYLYVVTKP